MYSRNYFQASVLILLWSAALTIACFNHPVVGSDALAGYVGQSDESEDELDPELLSVFALQGAAGAATDPSTPTSAATEITMYQFGTTDGGIGGLAGANALCDLSPNKPSGTTGVAFLSTNAQDIAALSGVPAALPVVGPTSAVISTDWAGLFDVTGIDMSLFAAGVLPGGSEFFSGSDGSGFHNPGNSCTDWALGSGDSSVGNAGMTAQGWLDSNDPTNQCAGNLFLVCVAW